jgi:dCTP deaminase
MILADCDILDAMALGEIVLEPFNRKSLGSNSYDVHLGKTLANYSDAVLDCASPPTTDFFEIPPEGFVLRPGTLYLGVTEEYTETHKTVPFLDGKSSIGRLGIAIHVTAGVASEVPL